jgi:CHAD domain-containing protein
MRLPETAELDPAAPIDRAALARIDADLAARAEDAMAGLEVVLTAPRYLALIDDLLIAANDPPLVPRVRGGALNHLVGRTYHRLVLGDSVIPGAAELAGTAGQLESDDVWHEVRKRAKAARYAAEAAVDLDDHATRLAHALADVTDLLGEHQDAVLAAATWLSISMDDPDDHALAITAGRLAERERAQARQARDRYPEVWAAASRARLIKWLR